MVKLKKCYTINGIVHIVKNNKLMELCHLKDLQELFPLLTTLIMLNNLFLFSEIPCFTERKKFLQ